VVHFCSALPVQFLSALDTTQSGTYILFLREGAVSTPVPPVTGDVSAGGSLLWMLALLGAALVTAGVYVPRSGRKKGFEA